MTSKLNVIALPALRVAGIGQIHCITQDTKEPAGPEFLAVCDDNPVDVMTSRFCPPECGGHPICAPCLKLARETGVVQ